MAEDRSDPVNDFPWPNRKDRPFRSKPPQVRQPKPVPTSAAEQVFQEMEDLHWDYEYRDGYFWAGENLARDLGDRETLEKDGTGRRLDGVYLPMLYCYRHYLEVSLKYMIKILKPLSGLDAAIDLQKEHGLMPLWNEAKRHMKGTVDAPKGGSDDADKNVERLINEFHRIDASSQTFRYRRDKHDRPQEGSIPSIDLDQLINVMRGLRNYFSHCEERADQAAEYFAETGNDMPLEYE